MSSAESPRSGQSGKPAPAVQEPEIDETEAEFEADDLEGAEDDPEAADELSEETGIDLTDASELDADNVPADEEFDRVMQAPD